MQLAGRSSCFLGVSAVTDLRIGHGLGSSRFRGPVELLPTTSGVIDVGQGGEPPPLGR